MWHNNGFVISDFESRLSVPLSFIANYFIMELVVVAETKTYIYRRQGDIMLSKRVQASLVAASAH